MLIEKLEQLNELISNYHATSDSCIIVIKDNKSGVNVQSFIVKHPVELLRNLNEISKQLRLPVSDMDIILVGFLLDSLTTTDLDEKVIISPYVYFKKPDDVSVNVGSDSSTPPVED